MLLASMSTLTMELSPSSENSSNLGLMHNALECSPTALTLKYTNKDSVPSTTILNKLLCCFGPLIESKTELLVKTNGVRVVFQKRCDAENAVTHVGKYRFGSSLQSFRLKILPQKPKKGTGKRGMKSKKESSFVHDVYAV
ncbi:putative non-specific serine/threonine protein kinase [Medicago truncatula]|nr:putative non-specific serine/threonine protein kinase [Medicago truncatula]